MATISKEKIAEMVKLYDELGTYAAVARKVGSSPSTVSKYVNLAKEKESIVKKNEKFSSCEINIPLPEDVDLLSVLNFRFKTKEEEESEMLFYNEL